MVYCHKSYVNVASLPPSLMTSLAAGRAAQSLAEGQHTQCGYGQSQAAGDFKTLLRMECNLERMDRYFRYLPFHVFGWQLASVTETLESKTVDRVGQRQWEGPVWWVQSRVISRHNRLQHCEVSCTSSVAIFQVADHGSQTLDPLPRVTIWIGEPAPLIIMSVTQKN